MLDRSPPWWAFAATLHDGFAQLATLVKPLKASRPGAPLLDGGDTWQGSTTALWPNAQDMADACKPLGVDVMPGHWEFTQGTDRVRAIVEKDFKGQSTSQHARLVRVDGKPGLLD